MRMYIEDTQWELILRTHNEDVYYGRTLRLYMEDAQWGYILRTHSEDVYWGRIIRMNIEDICSVQLHM